MRSHARLSGRKRRQVLVWLLLTPVMASCEREPPEATPEGAVLQLIERFRLVNGNPEQAAAVFELLSEASRENLRARAERYAAASGKHIDPPAMLVPSRLRLRFEVAEATAQIVGGHALVEVLGAGPGQRAEIACVYERDAWRVHIPFPPLPPETKRPGVDDAPPNP